MIAVCIVTYNQEAFIAQAIDSVQMQQCDEPIRIYIGDDASTDRTQAICERYAAQDERIVYIRRNKNLGLVNNTLDLYRRIMADGCKYIAMLDGDAYWTDPPKLQLQVAFLRVHPDVGFVHTNGQTSLGSGTTTFEPVEGVYGANGYSPVNCTVFFRANLLSNELINRIEAQHFILLDYPLYGVFYQKTKWAYLPQQTAVWREHTSVSQPKTAQAILALREERCRMWKWLDELFPGQVGYSDKKAQDYLFGEMLNLIYRFNDRSLVTPELLNSYKPDFWKQKIKQKALKNSLLYTILQFFRNLFA